MDDLKYLSLKQCDVCGIFKNKVNKTCIRRITTDHLLNTINTIKNEILLKNNKQPNDKIIKMNDVICGKCRTSANNYEKHGKNVYANIGPSSSGTQHLPEIGQVTLNDPVTINTITLSIPRTVKSDKSCVICKTTKSLIDIPEMAYVDTYITHNIMIPPGGKCCQEHIDKNTNKFTKKDLAKLEIVSDTVTLNEMDTKMTFDRIRTMCSLTIIDKFSSKSKLTDGECMTYTGYNKEEFSSILNDIKSMRNTTNRDVPQALATYLFWLRTGLPQTTIASILSLGSHQKVSDYCTQIRTALMKDFVHKNLGANYLTRNDWTQHKTLTAKELFNVPDDKLVLVADGTYIYTQKSRNNTLQRKQYSVHQHDSLVKPFVVCTTNGKIVDIYGLFPATLNDATILGTILSAKNQECVDLQKLIKPDDHIILDRGFKDIISTLQTTYGLHTHIPSCVPPKQKQLTWEQGNQSRFVTKCRWVVEAINAKLKTMFRANDHVHMNVTLPHTLDDLKISAALINKFSQPYNPDSGNEMAIIKTMKQKLTKPNRLETLFMDHHIDKKRTLFTKNEHAYYTGLP